MTDTKLKGTWVVDSWHEFRVLGEGDAWQFRYRVYSVADGFIVVFTESAGSAISVPMMHVEQLASEILPNVVSSPDQRDRVTWVCHAAAKRRPITTSEFFVRVRFNVFFSASEPGMGQVIARKLPACSLGWFSQPEWSRITREELEALIGMEFV
jgi:hypothetical protein